MASVMERTMSWIDLTVDVLRSRATDFPISLVGRRLLETFDIDVAALTWRRSDGSVALTAVTHPGSTHGGLTAAEATALMLQASNSELLIHHPLVRWTDATHAFAPQSSSRVPADIRRSARSGEVHELLHSVGVDQELSLPITLRGSEYLTFSLNRAGAEDFSDEDMITATRIQPLLVAIRCQAQILGQPAATDAADSYDITGRELAVLRLLADGRTSGAIGKALGCSARTVEKHLEHLYRKLRVSDRISAVRVAEADGLVTAVLPVPRLAGPGAE
jgi:DNA-binding NarL/FixJ family response regulator